MSQIIYFAFIVILFFAFFLGVLNFLPVGDDLPDGITNGIVLIYGYMQLFNFFFPIDQLFLALTAALTLQAAIFVWFIIRWVLALATRLK